MKKLFLILATFLISFTIFAQDKEKSVITEIADGASQVITSSGEVISNTVSVIDTSSNFKKIYSDITATISTLASSLKVGAERIYTVLIKQQIVKSIVYTILILIFSILGYKFIRFAFKSLDQFNLEYYEEYKNSTNNPDRHYYDFGDKEGPCSFLTIGIIFSIIAIMLICFSIDIVVTGFINPEYGALKEIIEMASQLGK